MMQINIKYLGHSGFLIYDRQNRDHSVAIDPFLTGNPVAKQTAAEIKCSYVAISHGHADHFGEDTLTIAKANDATVVAAFEITEYCGSKGITKAEPMNPGGRVETPFGFIALTRAFHSSSYNGQYMGMPCGIILNIAGVTIYHAGDTDLFSDMKLIGEIYKPTIAMLPIGDRFTMGPELAAKAAELVAPKYVIPMHYNTWPPIEQDPAKLKPAAISVKAMKPGEMWEFG